MHVRKLIRDKLRQVLETTETAEGRVYGLERSNVGEDDTPCIMYRIDGESIEPASMGRNRLIERSLTFTVQCISQAGRHKCEDELDAMAGEVEVALAESANLDGLVKSITPMVMTSSVDTQSGVGVIAMQFNSVYYTNIKDPTLSR